MNHIGIDASTVILFALLTIAGLATDLLAHRKDGEISFKSALFWTLFWVAAGSLFGIYLYLRYSAEAASLYFAGYAFEMALSVDNLFAIMAIFAWFGIKSGFTHRVLYWGVLGAVIFRLIFVVIGSALFALGPYVELVFAFIVGLSAVLMMKSKEGEETTDFSSHPAYKAVSMIMPVFPKLYGHAFFLSKAKVDELLEKDENKDISLKRKAAYFATPLFLCLAIVETSDVMFAFDSVPAVIAVSQDPFIVYSCMIFAMLGLRSMYFILDKLRESLVHLEKAVIVLLFFVSFKLLASACHELFGVGFEVDVYTSLAVIATVLTLGVLSSFFFMKKA